MIEVQNLSRSFLDKKRGVVKAVDNVSFQVQKGEIFGLLGPNGAGKSTTLRVLATLLAPNSGTARMDGFDVVRQSAEVRSRIGFLTGDMGLYLRMSPREILHFFAKLSGVADADVARRAQSLIDLLDMRDFADTRTDKLSSGMKQKTAIARTLVHDPPILILDEPTATLDVPTARVIEAAILEAKARGKCILYSTHIMEEAEYLCDRIAVIHQGEIKISGTMADLRQATGKQRLREIFLDLLGLPADPRMPANPREGATA
ncbi:MAG: ATP-binding cassette domain-containing protein [Bryobacter sp.]|nr:ATP-binding cassette domain-containing protein [Bryobacter sp.]